MGGEVCSKREDMLPDSLAGVDGDFRRGGDVEAVIELIGPGGRACRRWVITRGITYTYRYAYSHQHKIDIYIY